MLVRAFSTLLLAAFVAACGTGVTLPVGQKAAELRQAPTGYQRLFSPAPHAFRFSGPGEPVRRGQKSERYELRAEDCGGKDCANLRSRSEVAQPASNSKARLNKDIWYGWSFYNDQIASYSRKSSLRTVFGQWKLGGSTPAIIRLVQIGVGEGNWQNCDPAICTRSSDTNADVVVQLEDMRSVNGWEADKNFGYICKLFSMEQNRGKWVDLVINTNFSTQSDGYLRVWVNGQLRCSYFGQLVATSAIDGKPIPTNRRGIFVSSTKRWNKQNPGKPRPTLIAYYDEFLIGKSRKKVDTLLREASGARPKD